MFSILITWATHLSLLSLHILNKICNKHNFRIYSVITKVAVFKGSKQITENVVNDNNVAEQIRQFKYWACSQSIACNDVLNRLQTFEHVCTKQIDARCRHETWKDC